MSKFRRVLKNLILATVPPAISGKVKEVDETKYTCVVTPFDEGADYHEVRLKVNVDDLDQGLICIPDIGSEVLVAPLFNNDRAYYVVKFSKVKKWSLKTVSGRTLEFDADGKIKINGEDFGGLVKVDPNVEKLNALEQDINTLKGLVSGWVVVPSDGGAALKTALAPWYGQSLAVTTKEQLENPNVVHG